MCKGLRGLRQSSIGNNNELQGRNSRRPEFITLNENINMSIEKLVSEIIKLAKIPKEIICLDCLNTMQTKEIISNNESCTVCENKIDVNNLSQVEI